MDNVQILINHLEKDETKIGKYSYFNEDGSCNCVIGHAMSLAGMSSSPGGWSNKLSINEIWGVRKKLSEHFPELSRSWSRLQHLNDETADKESVINYIKETYQFEKEKQKEGENIAQTSN